MRRLLLLVTFGFSLSQWGCSSGAPTPSEMMKEKVLDITEELKGTWLVSGPAIDYRLSDIKSPSRVFWIIGSKGKAIMNIFHSQDPENTSFACVEMTFDGKTVQTKLKSGTEDFTMSKESDAKYSGNVRGRNFQLESVDSKIVFRELKLPDPESINEYIENQCR